MAGGMLTLASELRSGDSEAWIQDGLRQLGHLHDAAVVKVEQDSVFTEDMNLLYYYRNRLTGYGLE